MRYRTSHPGHLQDAVNRGSLTGTVTEDEEKNLRKMDNLILWCARRDRPPTLGSEVRCSIQLSYGRAGLKTMLLRGSQERRSGTRIISVARLRSMAGLAPTVSGECVRRHCAVETPSVETTRVAAA